MKKELIGIFICLLLVGTVFPISGQVIENSIIRDNDGNNPLINGDKWIKKFGGDGWDLGFYAQETSDGGFIVGGETSSFGNENGKIWLIKTDSIGNLIWEGFYGGIFGNFCSDVQETSDGGYIITGYNMTYNDKFTQYALIKVDSNGDIIWEKYFGDIHQDCGVKVRELEDGGFISLGFADVINDNIPREGYIWLIKTDSNGDILWDNKFGEDGYNIGLSLDLTDDNGFIIAGLCVNSNNKDYFDLWIIKTDGNGDIIWEKKYQNEIYYDLPLYKFDIQTTSDDCFIIVGNINYDSVNCDIWLLKIDGNGNILWEKVFSDYAPRQEAYAVRETNDGGFIIAGITSMAGFEHDVLIIKTDNQGEEIWSNNKRLKGFQYIYSVEQTTDGGYIFTGHFSKPWPLSDIDYLWLIKTDSNGDYPTFISFNRFNINSVLIRLFERFPILSEVILSLLR